MKPLTREWVEKAEADWGTTQREFRVRPAPNYDAVCFHAQQCAEKYLKAYLQETETGFPRTHHLGALLDLAVHSDAGLEPLRSGLTQVSSLAVGTRYPGFTADSELASQAIGICRQVRHTLRGRLGLQ